MEEFLEKLAAKGNRESGDYLKDGLLMCGRCHSPKQAWIDLQLQKDGPPASRLVSVQCRCAAEQQRREEAQRRAEQFEARITSLWMDGITDRSYFQNRFSADDRHNPTISDACMRYVDKWPDMKAENIGLLFYGSVGAGKSFFACCIANALLERQVEVAVTSFPRLLNLLQTASDRQALLDRLQVYQLLVIDDLGVERDSSYAMEQVYNVIDARSRSGLPLIITTNLSLQDLKSPSTMQHGRIYDRILELCPAQIKLTGESRRIQNAERRKKRAQEILLGE